MKYGNEISLSRIIENLKKFFDLKADKSSLSKVATSNDYTDLDNKPIFEVTEVDILLAGKVAILATIIMLITILI